MNLRSSSARLQETFGIIMINIEGAHFMLVKFKSGRARRIDSFSRKNLKGALLNGLNLAYVDFSGSQLTGADFTNSNLVGANFEGADLCDVSFRDCNLCGADFSQSNSVGVIVSGATLDEDATIHFIGKKNLRS